MVAKTCAIHQTHANTPTLYELLADWQYGLDKRNQEENVVLFSAVRNGLLAHRPTLNADGGHFLKPLADIAEELEGKWSKGWAWAYRGNRDGTSAFQLVGKKAIPTDVAGQRYSHRVEERLVWIRGMLAMEPVGCDQQDAEEETQPQLQAVCNHMEPLAVRWLAAATEGLSAHRSYLSTCLLISASLGPLPEWQGIYEE